MELNKEQREAVEYLEGPLLVLAGPGTGKTQLLSEKVAYILKNTDVDPSNILCVTFTDTGAFNMRERLKSLIGKDALRVNISTYHVLGREILGAYQGYAEDYNRRLDEVIDEVRQFKIIKELQSKLPGTDILRGDNVKDVIAVISEAKGAGLTSEDLRRVAEQNIEDSAVISEAVSPYLLNVVPRKYQESLEVAYQPIWEILRSYASEAQTIPLGMRSRALAQAYGPKRNTPEPLVERNISQLARDLKTALDDAAALNKVTPLSNWKDSYFERTEKGGYRLKDRVANKKLLSVARIMGQYEEYLRENGLYDFDDMIEEAARALREDEGFRLTLSEKYQYIMLDEFQDTNPSQLAIIKLLTDYEKPNIMAVGDDDQAIYEFQGALASNFRVFEEHYGAKRITLKENYRSTQEILDFAKCVIQQAPDRFDADKELHANRPAPEKSQIVRREFLSSDEEYGWIADEIARLVAAGVPQKQIAVISYKTKYFMPLLAYLKARPGINIAYDKQDNLLENPRIHEILTICRFTWELANERKVDTSLVEILSCPCFKLPPLEVIKLAGKARNEHKSLFEVASASESSDITGVVGRLAALAGKSFTEPLFSFLDYVTGARELDGFRSPWLEFYTRGEEYETFTLYENLAALRGRIERHFGEKPLRVADLVEMADDYEGAEIQMSTASPYKDADDAVQILSAHKSKGLEFEHVFVISADHTAWGKGKGNNNLLALPKNLTFIRHTGVTDGEKLRVLYVALTRAKSHLYITNSLHDFKGKSPERLEYLEEAEKKDEETGEKWIESPFLPSLRVGLDYVGSASLSSEKRGSVANLESWLRPYVELRPDMREIYAERVADLRFSASALTSFVDIAYAGPVEFFREKVLRVPPEPETEAMAYGTLIHAVFEAVTKRGISDEEAAEMFVAELEKKDLEASERAALKERGLAGLAASLEAFSGILRSGRAEVNLGAEHLVVNGVPVTGKIDHITIDEEAKTIEVYDFKTGGYHKEKWQSHATLYKYMLQLEFYKMLLENSREFGRYRVARAHILFVTPDKDGEVYDKVYEYSEGEEAEFLDLLAAVHREVSTLEFLDDPEVFLAPDKERGVKDIKEFVKLLIEKNE